MMRCGLNKGLSGHNHCTGGRDALIKATEENFPEASLDILQEARNVTNATLQIPGISAEPVLFVCSYRIYIIMFCRLGQFGLL